MTLAAPSTALAPFRHVEWMPRDIEVDRRPGGEVRLRSRIALAPHERCMGVYLDRAAAAHPDRVWLAERDPATGAWRSVTFAEGKRKVDSLSQALVDLGKASPGPLAILSENSVAHGLLTVAAMQVGVAVAPISPAYSLQSQDHAKLRYIFELLKPGVVFVEDAARYQRALEALGPGDRPLIALAGAAGAGALDFETLAATPPTADVARAAAKVDGDTVAKFLFTSGSTGMPKAVINTQRMLCANVAMLAVCRPAEDHGVTLDWLPWNHTMAGNGVFNYTLASAGSLYIDDGRPMPGLMDRTLRNLREISPTTYTNAPAGYAALVVALEEDASLRASFFQNLKSLGYGGARLPEDLYERLQDLAVRTTGERIAFASYYGATETAPLATCTHWPTERSGLIGLPLPGVELKLVPVDAKYEVRIRAITVTPGYYGAPELTDAAFDEEGFYRIGDLVQFVDPEDPNEGLAFAGRLAEEFKLLTGTFVPTGAVRVDAIAAASPILNDALVTGQDRAAVGLLAWPNVAACRRLAGDDGADLATLVRHPAVVAKVREGLAALNADHGFASSRCVARVLLMTEPPSVDAGEITDKGYINQRIGLTRRAELVDRLYQEPPGRDVIVVHEPAARR